MYLDLSSSRIVTREQLGSIPTPPPTDTWQPVPHKEVVDALDAALAIRGYTVVHEEFAVNKGGKRLYGMYTFAPDGHPDWVKCLGFQNSHDKSMAVRTAVGVRVLVSDTTCIGGEMVIRRKHTSGLELYEHVKEAMGQLVPRFEQLESNIQRLQETQMSPMLAKALVVGMAQKGCIASADIVPIVNEYEKPQYPAFAPRTEWSLYNSITEVAKKFQPQKAYSCYRGLAEIFQLAE